FPYKPGFFIFREGPPILEIVLKLNIMPDVFLINSHGICHPLGIGAASHIGILIEKPTIGVAQNILCGDAAPPKNLGDISPIFLKNKIAGYAFLTQLNTKPIYISPGHLITLETAIKIVKNTIKAYKLPEPLRLAHQLANLTKSKQLI
ncbi:MAG: endonuclease V, partial [Promethearchaeota archaeon]